MKGSLNKALILLFLTFVGIGSSYGQSKEELEKKRAKLNERIEYTNKLIEKKKNDQRLTQTELVMLNKKIDYREELIRTINHQIHDLNERIEENHSMIGSLEEDLAELKEEYAKMVRHAYMNRNPYDRLLFIFTSEDLYQAYRRIKYLQQYADYRKRQARSIERTKKVLNEKVVELKEKKKEKKRLLQEKTHERERLAGDKQEQQKTLTELQKEEKHLRNKLAEQKRKREQLTAAIKRVIEEEVRKTRAANKGQYKLTPEAQALSSNFQKNKGKLPWPVKRGVITSTFGEHPHPTLGAGIKIKNNGVDIATEEGSMVRAVFEGTVSSVIVIPGAGKAVMIKHGAYRTVYSNLKEVFVTKGDKVENKEEVGLVLTDDTEDKTEAHFEIWKISGSGNKKEDPSDWIYQR